MKKTFITAGLLVLVLAASCSTAGAVWDESVPPEKSATVRFGWGTIKSYNGISITRKRQGVITIPEGEAIIGLEIYTLYENVMFHLRGMEFTCYLEGGKTYTVIGETKDELWGVGLYEGKVKAVVGKKYVGGTLLEFIPFKNQPDSFEEEKLSGFFR
jgi:hypothetical protein